MTLYEFVAMSPEDQRMYWMEDSRFLMTCHQDDFMVSLYALDSFFVEIWYTTRENQIELFRAFQSVGPLDDYLPSIQVVF